MNYLDILLDYLPYAKGGIVGDDEYLNHLLLSISRDSENITVDELDKLIDKMKRSPYLLKAVCTTTNENKFIHTGLIDRIINRADYELLEKIENNFECIKNILKEKIKIAKCEDFFSISDEIEEEKKEEFDLAVHKSIRFLHKLNKMIDIKPYIYKLASGFNGITTYMKSDIESDSIYKYFYMISDMCGDNTKLIHLLRNLYFEVAKNSVYEVLLKTIETCKLHRDIDIMYFISKNINLLFEKYNIKNFNIDGIDEFTSEFEENLFKIITSISFNALIELSSLIIDDILSDETDSFGLSFNDKFIKLYNTFNNLLRG